VLGSSPISLWVCAYFPGGRVLLTSGLLAIGGFSLGSRHVGFKPPSVGAFRSSVLASLEQDPFAGIGFLLRPVARLPRPIRPRYYGSLRHLTGFASAFPYGVIPPLPDPASQARTSWDFPRSRSRPFLSIPTLITPAAPRRSLPSYPFSGGLRLSASRLPRFAGGSPTAKATSGSLALRTGDLPQTLRISRRREHPVQASALPVRPSCFWLHRFNWAKAVAGL